MSLPFLTVFVSKGTSINLRVGSSFVKLLSFASDVL